MSSDQALASLIQDLECLVGERLEAEELDGPESRQRQVEMLLRQARVAGLEVPAVGGDLSARMLSVYENNLAVLQAYRPRPYRGNVVMVAVREAPGCPSPEAASYWRDLVGPGLDLYRVAGNHTTMLRPPHVQELAAVLRFCLARTAVEIS